MRIGITYLYTILKYGYPPTVEGELQALKEIRDMGFHYLEMESLGSDRVEILRQNKALFMEKLSEYGIHVHNFCVVDPELTNINPEKRKAAYDRFRSAMEIGIELGAETIHLASYAPPVSYIGKKPYALGEDYSIENTVRLKVPEAFDWNRIWDAVVESSRFAADQAAEFGKIVLMEPRVGEVICSVDSMLRLIKDVDRPNFKANFDVGHFSAQRENAVIALYKLKDQFANIHIADNDPVATDHLPLGRGSVDWEEFFTTLKRMNYQGYLGLDLSASDTLGTDLIESAVFIKKVCSQLGMEVEM